MPNIDLLNHAKEHIGSGKTFKAIDNLKSYYTDVKPSPNIVNSILAISNNLKILESNYHAGSIDYETYMSTHLKKSKFLLTLTDAFYPIILFDFHFINRILTVLYPTILTFLGFLIFPFLFPSSTLKYKKPVVNESNMVIGLCKINNKTEKYTLLITLKDTSLLGLTTMEITNAFSNSKITYNYDDSDFENFSKFRKIDFELEQSGEYKITQNFVLFKKAPRIIEKLSFELAPSEPLNFFEHIFHFNSSRKLFFIIISILSITSLYLFLRSKYIQSIIS